MTKQEKIALQNYITVDYKGKKYKISPFGSQYLLEEVDGFNFVQKTIGYYSAWTNNTIDKLLDKID